MENNLYEIRFLERKQLVGEYYQFTFEKPAGFEFKEGQYAVFGFVNQVIQNRPLRSFSILTSNHETEISFATKIAETPSEFKKMLINLQPNDLMTMRGPLGHFIYDPNTLSIFIAGGIGITPIRSMIFSNRRITNHYTDILIYSELEKHYPYDEELTMQAHLEIFYAYDIEPTQILIRQIALQYLDNVHYYLSGSPGFVRGITALLTSIGVMEDKIMHDEFVGY